MKQRATAAKTRAGADDAPARGPGRPRSEEAHQSILTAVIELLPEHGIKGLTIEAVATRAGVGKTTIYRRWATKNELVIEALEQLPPQAAPPDTGSLQGDLEAMVQVQLRRLGGSGLPRIVPRVLAESAEDPDLHNEILARAVAPIRAMLTEMVQRGIDRGELREDLDVEAVVDVLHAVPVYMLLMAGGAMESIRDAPERVVPVLLDGISSSSAGRGSARPRN